MGGGLYGSLKPAGPHPEALNLLLGNVVTESLGVLLSSVTEVRVAADSPVEVHDALAVPREVDSPRHYVDVHQVVDYARLYVSLVLVDQHLLARVEDLHEGQVALELLVEGLVLFLVVLDAEHEVGQHLLLVHVCVVWAAYFHLWIKSTNYEQINISSV